MKTIKLLSYGIGRYDDVSPFMIADNSLELKVELPNVNGEFFLIAKNNDKTIKMSLSKYEPVTIEGLTAGELKAEVKHYLKGVLIKVYAIEPLILKEVDGSISAMPEIVELKTQLADLSISFVSYKEETNKTIEEMRNDLATAKNTITRLLNFALACKTASPYLTDIPLKEE